MSIEGRNVLVVEDIIDSGLTLSYLLRNLEPASSPSRSAPDDEARAARSTSTADTRASRSRIGS